MSVYNPRLPGVDGKQGQEKSQEVHEPGDLASTVEKQQRDPLSSKVEDKTSLHCDPLIPSLMNMYVVLVHIQR